MNLRWLLTVLEHHKDALVAVAALLAPFATVFCSLTRIRSSIESLPRSREAARTDSRLRFVAYREVNVHNSPRGASRKSFSGSAVGYNFFRGLVLAETAG